MLPQDAEILLRRKDEGARPLEVIAQAVVDSNINPQPRSGRQERLENLWNYYI
mgnify:CR=1 FL=1